MADKTLRPASSNREWFVDPRDQQRRLQVTLHREAGTVVLSVWRGNTCTGTFQLPVEEAPRLIDHLADCCSASTAARGAPDGAPVSRS